MAVNKVVINTENGAETLIDLTEDNVTAETLAEGATAHDASGARIMGTMKAGGGTVEWDDIQNRPFGEVPESDTLNAPDDILSRPSFVENNMTFYKVADTVLTRDDFVGKYYDLYFEVGFKENVRGNDLNMVVVHDDNSISLVYYSSYIRDSVTLLRSIPDGLDHPAGTYFACGTADFAKVRMLNITIEGFDKFPIIKTVPTEWLPEAEPITWNDIPGNPFGGSNSISWGSRGIDPTTLPAGTWVKMSDSVVTWEDVANIPEDRDLFSFIATDSVSYWNPLSNGCYVYPPFFSLGEMVACVVVDDNDNMYNGIEFRPDGVYFYTGDDYGDGIRAYPLSVTVPGFKFETYEPIDSRYMPECLQTETTTLTDTIAWESIYDDNYSVDPVKATGKKWLGQNIKVSDADIPVKSLPATASGWYTIGEGDNVYGHYYLDAQEIENGFYKLAMTDENGNTMDYGYCATAGSGYDTGLYLYDWEGGTFTCHAGAVFEVKTPKPIDPNYLPTAEAVPDAAGSTVTAEEFNALLSALRAAGYLAT